MSDNFRRRAQDSVTGQKPTLGRKPNAAIATRLHLGDTQRRGTHRTRDVPLLPRTVQTLCVQHVPTGRAEQWPARASRCTDGT